MPGKGGVKSIGSSAWLSVTYQDREVDHAGEGGCEE